jgi:ADP-ribose pyrophosphatase
MNAKRSSLPPNAKKVFSGKIFEVWQWEQNMFDGSTATFERLKRPDTVQVIVVVGDSILIQKEEQPDSSRPFTALPGGRCEAGEEPLEAAKRELLEETGYVSDDWSLWLEKNPVGKMEWTIYTFIARNCRKEQEPKLDAGERIRPHLISFDEFLALAEDDDFYSPDIALDMLKARFDPAAREALKSLLYGK